MKRKDCALLHLQHELTSSRRLYCQDHLIIDNISAALYSIIAVLLQKAKSAYSFCCKLVMTFLLPVTQDRIRKRQTQLLILCRSGVRLYNTSMRPLHQRMALLVVLCHQTSKHVDCHV